MTYEELVKVAKDAYCSQDASNIQEHVAIQFNVTGEAAGIFYLEINDGKVSVEPYEYYDRDAIVTADAQTLVELANGTLGMESAYSSGKIKAEGDLGKALLLKSLSGKKAAKKEAKKPAAKKAPATKKTCAKKPAAKKTAEKKVAEKTPAAKVAETVAKKEVKAEAKVEAKPAAKKAPAKKATKTEKKA